MLLGKTVRKAAIRTLTPEEAITFFALAENADSCARGTIDMVYLMNDTRLGIIKLRRSLRSLASKKAVKIIFDTYIEKGKEKKRDKYKVCIDPEYWKKRDLSIEPNFSKA